VPSYGVRSRQIYYDVLAEAGDDGLLLAEVVERVHARCIELGVRPFKPANAWRVLGSLVNDGLVSRTSLGHTVASKGPRTRYRAKTGVEGLQEALIRPQTTRVVSDQWGRKTSGYNAPSPRRSAVPSRLFFKVPGYIFEPTPRQRINRLVEDGSWENKGINWLREDGTPIRRWRWADQRALEAEKARLLKSKASQA
jgi:hypothetical protein